MGKCDGNCAACSGCARELVLSLEELEMLNMFAQIPFLPVAREMGDLTPVFLEKAEATLPLQLLERKGLISLDFHEKIKGFDYSAYSAYPIQGSMALTQRGQQVLELMEIQGTQEKIDETGKFTIDE